MNITMTREALVAKLQDRLAAARVEDARLKIEHLVQERDALKAFRQLLRDAMKWDYTKVKFYSFRAELDHNRRPSCPRSEATKIEIAIRSLTFDTRKTAFRISPSSDLYNAIHWLPIAERPNPYMC